MPIIGFNFNKVSVEKQNPIKGKVNIAHNVKTIGIEEEKLNISTPGDTLSVKFRFSIDYSPDIGNITLLGNVLYMDDSKKIKAYIKEWKEKKELPRDIMPVIMDTILARCNIRALILAEDVALPPPIRLPRVKKED